MSSVTSLVPGGLSASLQQLQSDLLRDGAPDNLNAAGQNALSAPARKAPASSPETPAEGAGSGALPPDNLGTKIETLIRAEVSNGNLSVEQAARLQSVFATAFGPGPTDDGSQVGTSPPSAAGPSQTAGAQPLAGPVATGDVGAALNDFLRLLQNAQSTASGYGARGNSSASATANGTQLINYKA